MLTAAQVALSKLSVHSRGACQICYTNASARAAIPRKHSAANTSQKELYEGRGGLQELPAGQLHTVSLQVCTTPQAALKYAAADTPIFSGLNSAHTSSLSLCVLVSQTLFSVYHHVRTW